jgi:hypothetical protein
MNTVFCLSLSDPEEEAGYEHVKLTKEVKYKFNHTLLHRQNYLIRIFH